MNSKKKKDTKEQYENVVRLVKRAEKAAEKFIEKNKKMDQRLQAKYA